ncbi:hybrid NRPS/PKS enzyme [Apiospora arundinis]
MPYVNEPIAVIGSGCRFPGGASTPSKLWDLLKDPRDVQRPIDRFRADNFYNQDGHYHGASNVLAAYLLSEDTKKFDTQFFNIPLSEAEAIDPQQRLLMETVFESLESAGLSMESLSGSNTAAYVGVMCDDFSQIVYGDSENVPTYAATGSARSILSNRISYFFNWHGPSMTIDTACSSSLIAVHQAVQVLRSGEAPVAIASGTNLIFGPTMFVAESNLNMLSPTGRSRMWDAGANGYARGEGVGSVVMKTLSAALRDGDHIEYIIRETGINQDGKTPGITMPSSEMQARLIRDTYARAGLDLLKQSDRFAVRKQSAPHSFVFSAASAKSLAVQLKVYYSFLEENPTYDLDTLFWTLFRRTAQNFRISFAASSVQSLKLQISEALEKAEDSKTPLGLRVSPKAPRSVLGVFTGQGAQWATMGRELILSSHFASSVIEDLEQSLRDLPSGDVPDWSLREELLASKEKSRIAEGVISQPLCTAVQIMVVQLLKRAGVTFKAVVGHSSGEIACAYVSGFISASDAIRIAYYRGKYTPLAKARAGAMIAMGTDMQDAIDLCSLPKLRKRAQLAASNSSASVTISGDADAIDLIDVVAKDEAKFARKLKVDTAYHSFHMEACSSPYIESLHQCDVQVMEPSEDACSWYTSVEETNEKVTIGMASALKGQYWSDNMLRPVLFSQALTVAVTAEGAPGLVLEVGPHAALKGPATLTIEEAVGPAPYCGTLSRGQDDALAILTTLGSIWSVLGASAVPSMHELQRAFSGDVDFHVAKDLPTYAWDHDRVIWNEPRVSRVQRLRSEPKHELLGARQADEGEGERRWRNYLKPKEMPWLRGHQIQGQMVYPAAAYAVMALEAARTLAPLKSIQLMQLQKFSIHKAISFLDDNAQVETLFCLSNIQQSSPDSDGQTSISATFVCYACMNKDAGEFTSMASGQVEMSVSKDITEDSLPARPRWVNNFVNTDVGYFYECLAELGYGYQGMFQGVTDLQRTDGGSKGTITIPHDDEQDESMPNDWVIHPATLDVAFQAVFAAVGAPGDGRLWSLHVPTIVDSIAINPNAYEVSMSGGVATPLPFDAFVVDSDRQEGIAGDVDLYDEDGGRVIVQIQGLHVTPLTKATAADDRETFASITWDLASPDLLSSWTPMQHDENDLKLASFAERLSLCILRDLCDAMSEVDVERDASPHQRSILDWAQHVVDRTRAQEHPTCSKEWLADSWDVLEAPAQRLAMSHPAIKACLDLKEKLTRYMGSELPSQEEVVPSTQYLDSIPGYQDYLKHMVNLITQLAFKHRNMRILEIGAGKGNCTKEVLQVLGQNFTSYTCTDADATNFDTIRPEISASQSERVQFKTLDLWQGQSPAEQDFVTGHYDLVIASNVLHTASDVEETMKQIRTLVRPGGYLAMLEPTNTASVAIGLTGCMSPAWFSGIEEDRKYSPFVTHDAWDEVLRATGFSGLDTATPEEVSFSVPYSVMCSMAVDNQMEIIRDPLACASQIVPDSNLLIIGGKSVHTRKLVRDVKKTLAPFFHNVMQAETILDVSEEMLETKPTTISLAEMDQLLFKPFTEEKFKAIVKICDSLQTMLWVTVGSRGENPYMNMMVAVGRCLVGEMPHLRLQFLNFDGADRPTSSVVAHHLLRLHLSSELSGEPRKPNEPLHLIERELTIQNGTLLLPRYLPVENINARLNSDKRLITHDLDPARDSVAVEATSSSYQLRESNLILDSPRPDDIELSVTKSLLHAIKLASGALHLMLGSGPDDNKTYIALSENHQSLVSVPKSQAVEVDSAKVSASREAEILNRIAIELLAPVILAGASGSVLVHGSFPALAKVLARHASSQGIALTMTSVSSTDAAACEGLKLVHPTCPDRVLARLIPKDLATFVDLSEVTGEIDSVGSRFKSFIPVGCGIKKAGDIFSAKGFGSKSINNVDGLATALQNAVNAALSTQISDNIESQLPAIVAASATASLSSRRPNYMQAIDWRADATLPVVIRPKDETMRFRNDRTYFLVGLTGELGLQLTKWMVRHGAKYLALSSRSPKLDPDWLELVQSEGAIVKPYAMDVTSRSSVKAVHKRLCNEMPPVAGVMNGAMILLDGLFANKTHAEFETTLRPKVEGTVYLDEVFDSKDLDFFVVFSSLACVSGNMGQTAYAAANAFMCSLVAGRRMRGLAGSSINMPGIVGLGYLNRDTRKLDRLKNLGYVNISEWDFYQFLSEAISAGRPDSGMIPEITAGLKKLRIEGDLEDYPLWSKTPRFHWLRIPVSSSSDDSANGASKDGGSSVRSRLAEVSTEDELRSLLLGGLLGTLYNRLNMNPDEQGITPDTAIVQLGVDSLLAVDMRSWFTKELDLDMPVLKILGGATVYDLIEDAMGRLSRELVPKLAGSSGDAAAAPDSDADQSQLEKDGQAAEEVDEIEADNDESSSNLDAGDEAQEESQEPVMAPIDLPVFEDEQAANEAEEASSGIPSSKCPSSEAGDIEEVDAQSETTQLTSPSETTSEYVKVDADVAVTEDNEVENITRDGNQKPAAKLFSQFQEQMGGNPQINFVKKVKMSYGTSRFWFLIQYLRDPTTFNLLCHVIFTGDIRFDDADRCIKELGNRHEVFRTCFFADQDNLNEPTLGVMEESHLRLERRFADSKADVDAEGEELMKYEYKIEQGETIRMKMISLPDSTHHLLFGFHHIILDGFSFNLLLAELNPLYDGQQLQPVKTTFSEFSVRQRQQVTDGSLDKHFQFWKDVYVDFPEPLPLFSLARSSRRSLDLYDFHETSIVLDTRTNRQIKSQCRRFKITPFHFFLAVLRTFLGRHLGVDDLVIGVADANRVDSSLDETVGFMLNLLPLRFKNDSEASGKKNTFKDVAQKARDTVYEALAHSALPFDALLERLEVPRSGTHSPLFQAWMDYRPIKPGNRPTLFGSEANGTQTVGRNGYDLTLDITELDDSEPRISFRTQKYLYSDRANTLLFESYMKMVRAFAAKFETPVDSVPLWNPRDIEAAKTLGRGPELQSKWPETVSHRIAEIALQNPTSEAVKDEMGTSITYETLQQRVQAISKKLAGAGVKEGSRVAVFQEPTAEWICSLLAIWHAGATYIPLDYRVTESLSRLALIARSAKPSAILCHDATADKIVELESPAPAINVSTINYESGMQITGTKAKATTAAAILFTSGSTGAPKGVVLPHRALRNTFEGLTTQYGIGAEKVLQQSAFTFDFSLDQIVCSLANAGSVYVVSKANRSDPSTIAKIIETETITYTRATPSEYASWIAHGEENLRQAANWKFAWAGGEVLPRSVVQSLGQLELPALKLYNSYGPAESITCAKIEVPFEEEEDEEEEDLDDLDSHNDQFDDVQEAPIPAGRPLPNYSVYIVDHNMELLPEGASGEIIIGGPSVGTGYMNDEKLSEAKFIGNAYISSSAGTDNKDTLIAANSRIVYRTGDMGRLRSDGSIEFVGRMAGDTMVKVRGMRFDLQEIENSILSASDGALQRAVVSLRGGNLLVAHVQFNPDESEGYTGEGAQKAFLRQLRYVLPLPLYMIPSVFVPLEEMPTNAHGKTDRNAIGQLALPPSVSKGRSGDALDETEGQLLQVWKDVVGAEANDVIEAIQITTDTSFFELGGNSLLLLKLQMLISMRFDAKLSLIDLFGAASLGAMATKIKTAPKVELVDWDKETQLTTGDFEDVISPTNGAMPIVRSGVQPLRVLLTGATGSIGRKLVDELASSTKVVEIHAVAVRSSTITDDETNKLSASPKLKIYSGDLASPRLGLSETDFASLASSVDLIIHAGANRSLTDDYSTLRGVNFASTKTLVQLAARRRIPIHFFSSGSVSVLDEAGATPSPSGAEGYMASKWASERYLGHAALVLSVPVTVHRVSGAETGQRLENTYRELVEHVHTHSDQMKLAPTPGAGKQEATGVVVNYLKSLDNLAPVFLGTL